MSVWCMCVCEHPHSAACGQNLLCNYRGEKMRETAIDRDKIESV